MSDTLVPLFENIQGLESLQRDALIKRYAQVLNTLQTQRRHVAVQYHVLRVTSTIGSLLIPALLSAQYATNVGIENDVAFFWITWIVSFLVTLSNGVLTMFKIDKQYVSFQAAYEQLYSEGWQYLQLGGRYSHGKKIPTHANQLLHFIHRIESIMMHTVQEEFIRIQEHHETAGVNHDSGGDTTGGGGSGSGGSVTTGSKSLIPPSPMTASTRKSRRKPRGGPTPVIQHQTSFSDADTVDGDFIIQMNE